MRWGWGGPCAVAGKWRESGGKAPPGAWGAGGATADAADAVSGREAGHHYPELQSGQDLLTGDDLGLFHPDSPVEVALWLAIDPTPRWMRWLLPREWREVGKLEKMRDQEGKGRNVSLYA